MKRIKTICANLKFRFYLLTILLVGCVIVHVGIFALQKRNGRGRTLNEFLGQGGLNLTTLSPDDPRLITIIRDDFLIASSEKPYHLTLPKYAHRTVQAEKILQIFRNKTRGFFIECGAMNGEFKSTTLLLEKDYLWSGILIEPSPYNFEALLGKHRKAWLVPSCLSLWPYAQATDFMASGGLLGKISLGNAFHDQVMCFPLYSILLAVGTLKIDYFSLDVEGDELKVLKTIPWNMVNITTLSVEYKHVKEGKQAIVDYMTLQGYSVYDDVSVKTTWDKWAADFIFYHPALL